ncbi:MAG: hypothetical protein ABI411_11250 [Tahibacter sp.]
MSLQTLLHEVTAIARTLCDREVDETEHADAVLRLHAIALAAGDADGRQSTRLAEGLALAPRDAARCVLDHRRTRSFLQALDAAIQSAQRIFAERPLRVLYAGCGPLAPFALLASCLHPPGDVQFSLVDVHPESLTAATALFDAIGHRDSLAQSLCADATTLQLDSPDFPHIAIAETLQQALSREPQVALTVNLAPQLRPGGIWLPHRIVVDLVLAELALEHASAGLTRRRIRLATLIDLHGDRAVQADADAAELPRIVTIPVHADGMHVLLCTRIEAGPGLLLDDYDSGLTHPLVLHALGTPPAGTRLSCRYRRGTNPGFEIVRLSSGADASGYESGSISEAG